MNYATLGKAPIAGENPAGTDCRYTVEFETLQGEIDKLASPTALGKVDWANIVQNGSAILLNQSKDLTVASYLAVGLIHLRKVNGLDEAIQIFRDLVENFWDLLHPPKKRMRGRTSAITWWLEKSEAVLETFAHDPLPVEQFERINGNLQVLEELLNEKMSDPPLLRPLKRQFERFPVEKTELPDKSQEPQLPEAAPIKEADAFSEKRNETISEKQPEPSTPPKRPPEPVAAEAIAVDHPPGQTASQPLLTAQDAMKSIDTAVQQIRRACHFLLQQDLKNPLTYRYRRITAWAGIDELPPNENGITLIPPPAPQIIDPLIALRDAANWPALIENAEQRVSQYIFWFDLQFMIAEALNQMGSEFQAPLKTICQETACFLQRLPGIEKLSFSDEMPFCEARTLDWISRIGLGIHGDRAGEQAPALSVDENIARLAGEAMALTHKRKITEAVELLSSELHRSKSRQVETRWRMAIVQVLIAADKKSAARPHMEQILADIDAFNMEQWDPDLALSGMILAWKVLTLDGSENQTTQAAALYNRIARIDPVEALRLMV